MVARNTVSMLAGSGARLLVQGAYFVLIARALGVEQYGAFVGVVALVAILGPFAPLGRGQILIRNVAREPGAFCTSWGNALLMTAFSGSALVAVVLLIARLVLSHRVPHLLVLLVAASDLWFAAVVAVSAQAFQAVERLHRTAQVYVVLTSSRAVAALMLFLLVSHPQALSWGFFYCLSSLVAALHAAFLVSSKLGRPKLSFRDLRSDLLEGLYFSVSLSSQSIYNDIDKTMLVRLSTFGAAGLYAAAYRAVDLSFQPVGALLSSTLARFFRHGRDGLSGTIRLTRQFLPWAVVYAILAGGLLILIAPVLPLILGHEFSASSAALRWLSPLVLLKTVHYFLANCLTGAGFQGWRSAIQVMVAGLNILLNLWLIPTYSWRGAAWASIASDGALALGVLLALIVLMRRETTAQRKCEIGAQTIS